MPLEHRQVAIDVPILGDLHPVVVPLLALDLDEAAEGGSPRVRRTSSDSAVDLDRLAEGRGQLLDALSALALLR